MGRNQLIVEESMRIILTLLALVVLISVGQTGFAETNFSFDLSIGGEGINGFHLAIGEYYRVPQREVIVIRERGIPDHEIPVVLFIATRAHVAPAVIIDLRLHRRKWTDITLHFGLSPEIFYVPVNIEVAGPPYGSALGHFKRVPRKKWKKIVLKDDEVINLVNLRFISEHHGYSPEEVIKLRSNGKDFVVINDEFKKGKKGKKEKIEKPEEHRNDKEQKPKENNHKEKKHEDKRHKENNDD
ncbi:MAG TPA: hypothetical protein VI489_01915 [Candidatus Brocadiaceae bacterium]